MKIAYQLSVIINVLKIRERGYDVANTMRSSLASLMETELNSGVENDFCTHSSLEMLAHWP